jgi:DTW domain-containing protein YfiP
MSRAFCYQCHRASVACLCGRIEPQQNQVRVVVLQHPDESSHARGSAIIAELGLQQYTCWVGEDFTAHAPLQQLLQAHGDELVLVFPGEQARGLQQVKAEKPIKILLFIDASWRKARKIWQTNPQLQRLNCCYLEPAQPSAYRIRKVPQPGYLSTLESIVEALRIVEEAPADYQPMLELFTEMIDFQIEQMGAETYKKHYQDK